eukprot:455773-Amphidinium_carterae.1
MWYSLSNPDGKTRLHREVDTHAHTYRYRVSPMEGWCKLLLSWMLSWMLSCLLLFLTAFTVEYTTPGAAVSTHARNHNL